jgi:hypothetical protein
MVVTFDFPLKGKFLFSDRNRGDLDWQRGKFSWRYRNFFQIEKSLRLRSYHPSPYASVEFFYESQCGKWSNTCSLCWLSLPHWQIPGVQPVL